MTTRAARIGLSCAVALACFAPAAARASAADAFENKIKPVSGQLYTKRGKLELTLPTGQVSLMDAFFSKYMVGAKLGYHFNEYLSLGVTGAYGTTDPTGSTSVCRGNEGCQPAAAAQLYQVPGLIRWMAGAEVAFSPVYGKLNVFAEKAVHFDLSIMAGPDLISYRGVIDANQASAGVVPGYVTTPGGHIGIGARIFLTRLIALRLELRDVVYSVSSLSSGKLQNQLFAELGLSFLIPMGRSSAEGGAR
jgi:outer membrane beta-barrel protein